MKKHSILTTIFPRLGFNNWTINQLLRRYGPDAVSFPPYISRRYSADGMDALIVPNLFDPLAIGNIDVAVHLSFFEIPPEHPKFNEIFTGKSNEAKAALRLECTTPNGRLDRPLDSDDDSETYYFLRRLIAGDPEITLQFNIDIFLVKFPIEDYEEKQQRHVGSHRKELVAMELTTGYRRYINHLLVLLKVIADERQATSEADFISLARHLEVSPVGVLEWGPAGDFHASVEDSWRLVCVFSSVQRAAKMVNLDPRECGRPVLSLNDFVNSIVSPDVAAGTPGGEAFKMVKWLHHEKLIRPQIALKKCIEYYIYESLPCIPVVGM